jgi:hypothetical protein
MRNPVGKALWSFGFLVLGAGLVLYAFAISVDRTVPARDAIIALFVAGFLMSLISFPLFLWTLFSAIGYARLMSGKGVIARWHFTADDWDRFRAFDKIRVAENPAWLQNDMRIRQQTPPQGVDVIVGRGNIIVDGSYHSIAGLDRHGREINWLNAPADPECIEFPKSYSRRGGSVDLTLRVPVPACARAEGVRVFEHYRPKENPIFNPSLPRIRLDGAIILVLGILVLAVSGFLLAFGLFGLGAPIPEFLRGSSLRFEEKSEGVHYGAIVAIFGITTVFGLLAVIKGLWQIIFRERNTALVKLLGAVGAVLLVVAIIAQLWIIFQSE